MPALAEGSPHYTHWSQPQPPGALAHIPGEDGWPLLGTTVLQLADPAGFEARMRAKYGNIYRLRSFGRPSVALHGPEANELVLFDRDRLFSSAQGWGPILDRLFPRGLMLLDFEQHRADRRALSVAFKPEPMRHHCEVLNRGIAARAPQWQGREIRFYDEIKQLSLDLAAESFLGLALGEEAQAINRAFVDMVQASVALVRRPLPFTKMGRGVKARRFLTGWFAREVATRRESEGHDMLSQFARATREDGSLLAVGEVVDHMIFLMMAAHDTITSSASSLVWLLASNPEWQEPLRAEALAATGGPGLPLAYDKLGKLEQTEMAFKEALRLIAPVPATPRRALRPFEFDGYRFPAGTNVNVSAARVHLMEEYWPDPLRFDPLRFTPEQVARRHKYAWIPFGGGEHMCIGLHFAFMQIKILMAQVLTRYRIEAAPGYAPRWQPWPIPKPRDGLVLTMRAL